MHHDPYAIPTVSWRVGGRGVVMPDILQLYAKLLSAVQFYAGGALRRYDGGASRPTQVTRWLRQ